MATAATGWNVYGVVAKTRWQMAHQEAYVRPRLIANPVRVVQENTELAFVKTFWKRENVVKYLTVVWCLVYITIARV